MSRTKRFTDPPRTFHGKLVSLLIFFGLLVYPFLIYFGLNRFDPRFVYAMIGGVLALRLGKKLVSLPPGRWIRALLPFLAAGIVVGIGALYGSRQLILFVPGLVTLSAFAVFTYTLWHPPSVVEVFARTSVPDLSEEDERYCRRVTGLWSTFFLFNSLVVFVLSGAAVLDVPWGGVSPMFAWTLYSGVVSYLIVGGLFVGEYVYRKWKFRRFRNTLRDRVISSVLPVDPPVKPTFVALHELPVHGRVPPSPVASIRGETLAWNSFIHHLGGLTDVLRSAEGDRWVLRSSDGVGFAVGLLSIWQSDGTAVIPPNQRPETLRTLLEEADGLIGDSQPDLPERDRVDPLGVEGSARTLTLVDPAATTSNLYTSGSTGNQRSVPKRLVQFEREILRLEQHWGDRLEDSVVLSTVSHHHIYGLLFKILWPLCGNRPFDPRTGLFPEEVVDTIRTSQAPVTLISSPVHLENLLRVEGVNNIAGDVTAIFSSGGPLPEKISHRCGERLGAYPHEILGSTETGGVAWRTRDPEAEAQQWSPLQDVSVRQDTNHSLWVRSPWSSAEGEEWRNTGDRVSVRPDGTFTLEGRVDRSVNLAGKKFDLTQIEDLLERHPRVREAAVVGADGSTESGSRRSLAGVVVLEGEPTPETEGDRVRWRKRLRGHCAGELDPVAIPARWVFVDELPRDAQGKVTVPELRAVVDGSGKGS